MPSVLESRFEAMGTQAQVKVVGGSAESLEKAERLILRCERLWSRFDSQSEISLLNERAGKVTTVSEETFSLLKDSVKAWELSEGIFNPLVGQSMIAAGYDRPFTSLSDPVITSDPFLPLPDPTKLHFVDNERSIFLPAGFLLDLGGFAKGVCIDLVIKELLQEVSGCLVNIGGDLGVAGVAPSELGWLVNCRIPSDEKLLVYLRKGAVCTSSKRKRTWKTQGGQEHHLRDPFTGDAMDSNIDVASVICERASQGEILAKMFIFNDLEWSMKFTRDKGVTGVLWSPQDGVSRLPGFASFEYQENSS